MIVIPESTGCPRHSDGGTGALCWPRQRHSRDRFLSVAKPPICGASPGWSFFRRDQPLVPLRQLVPEAPQALEALLKACLAEKAEDRVHGAGAIWMPICPTRFGTAAARAVASAKTAVSSSRLPALLPGRPTPFSKSF